MLRWKSQGALLTWAWAYPKAAREPEADTLHSHSALPACQLCDLRHKTSLPLARVPCLSGRTHDVFKPQ